MSIKITVEGHLTKAPELRTTTSGKSVTRFDLAHNFRERVGKDFKDVATIFFGASVWEEDGAAEVAELGLTKGSRVSVDGLWSKRSWIDKDGNRRISDVLTVSKVRLFTETRSVVPMRLTPTLRPCQTKPWPSRLHNQPASAGRDSRPAGHGGSKSRRRSQPNTVPENPSRLYEDPGGPVRLRANLRLRAFVRASAHRHTWLECATSGLHSPSIGPPFRVFEPERNPRPDKSARSNAHMTSSTMDEAVQTTTSVTRVDLDPRDLLVDVNIRTDARLDKAFVASIKDFGVLVPITAVRTATGDVRVRFGHRRTLAAIEADLATVPVEIVGDEATDDVGEIERILTQHAENAHRTALTDSEQLGVIEQLDAFGMSAAQIAKRTKIKRDTVNTALVVAKSDLAKAASDRYDFLTLEQAAAVAEFDDDPDAVKELIARAQKGEGFYHSLQRLRDQRKERLAKQPIIDELAAAGVTIIDNPGWGDATRRLERVGTNNHPMTPEVHAPCEGHVAWIDEEWIETDDDAADYVDEAGDSFNLTCVAVYGCTDPVAYGHIESSATPSRNSPQVSDEEIKAKRREVLANNKAWRAAETVRHERLKTFAARKSAPKGALRYILSELAIGGYQCATQCKSTTVSVAISSA